MGGVAAAGNVIGADSGNGVGISDSLALGAASNLVQGNFIGVTATLLAVPNGGAGVSINGARNNTIGGSSAAARNVIASNVGNGVEILNQTASGNQVEGNWIGYTGTATAGNSSDGVFINNAGKNTVGGITSGSGNVISGNLLNGIELRADPGNPGNSAGNQVIGNDFGTNDKGTATTVTTSSSSGPVMTVLGNLEDGILVEGVPQLTIGLPLAGGPGPINLGGNLISGNHTHGIQIVGLGAAQITIQANFIGTDVTGTLALANSQDGIFIVDTPTSTMSAASTSFGPISVSIGGSVPGTGNLISGNAGNGIEITGGGQTADSIQGNLIGTNLAGTSALSNSGSGVLLEGVSANTIGGTTGTNPAVGISGVSNLISGNIANGIAISTVTDTLGTAVPDSNLIQGNYIGTDLTGKKPVSNGVVGISNVTGAGVFLDGATNTTIGGTTAAARNLISANRAGGVAMQDGASGNVVVGNYIGTDNTGSFTDPEGNLTDADALSNDIQIGSGSTASNFGGGVLIINSPNNVIGSPTGQPRRALFGRRQLDRRHHGAGHSDRGERLAAQPGAEQLHRHEHRGHQGAVAPVSGIQTGNDGIIIVVAPAQSDRRHDRGRAQPDLGQPRKRRRRIRLAVHRQRRRRQFHRFRRHRYQGELERASRSLDRRRRRQPDRRHERCHLGQPGLGCGQPDFFRRHGRHPAGDVHDRRQHHRTDRQRNRRQLDWHRRERNKGVVGSAADWDRGFRGRGCRRDRRRQAPRLATSSRSARARGSRSTARRAERLSATARAAGHDSVQLDLSERPHRDRLQARQRAFWNAGQPG